jgi:hypothetical protein
MPEDDGHTASKVQESPTTTVAQITTPTIDNNDNHPSNYNNHVQEQSTCNTMICSQCRMFDSITTRMLPMRHLSLSRLDGTD